MTKLELEKENKKLRDQIRDLKKQLPEEEINLDKLPDKAVGVTLVGSDKKLAMVEINFDLSKNIAIIDKDSIITDGLGPLTQKARFKLVDQIILKNKERN